MLKQIRSKAKKFFFKPLLFASLWNTNTPVAPVAIDSSYAALCRAYPKLIRQLFANLDLERPELGGVKTAVQHQDWAAACEHLVTYYRQRQTPTWLYTSAALAAETPPLGVGCPLLLDLGIDVSLNPDAILEDTFTFQQATARVPRDQGGRLDWAYRGPHRDAEWGWFLNRHHHLRSLLDAYGQGGDPVYIECISDHLLDWIAFEGPDQVAKFQAGWRGMEVAHRVVRWAAVFYCLQDIEAFTPATRILMLASLLHHARYLRRLHAWGANWVVNEMKSLALIALCWPEFKAADSWLAYARGRIFKEMQWQVYADGVHKELTSHYHLATLRNFQEFATLLQVSGQEVPDCFTAGLEQMWNYLAYSIRPDGTGLLNNDSDHDFNRPLIAKMALVYGRPDWIYIATQGEAGIEPRQRSTVFPWAGQMIARNGWSTQAHWAFFDLGPMGIYYHIHNDKLHLSLAAHGRDLLVDSGRYSYIRGKFWQYFRGSAGHNVILIDGQGQGVDVREWRQPMRGNYRLASTFDFAKGRFSGGYQNLRGQVVHTRAMVYIHNAYWLVIDHIETDRPRQIQPLWHFHPDCTLALEADGVVTTDPEVGNLRITPCGSLSWQVQVVAGQVEPVQGWWSDQYNHKVANPTAVFSASIPSSITFAWVLVPAAGPVPAVRVRALSAALGWMYLKVEIDRTQPDEVAVRVDGSRALALRDGCRFEGECLIQRAGQQPVIALGRLLAANGKIIAEDCND